MKNGNIDSIIENLISRLEIKGFSKYQVEYFVEIIFKEINIVDKFNLDLVAEQEQKDAEIFKVLSGSTRTVSSKTRKKLMIDMLNGEFIKRCYIDSGNIFHVTSKNGIFRCEKLGPLNKSIFALLFGTFYDYLPNLTRNETDQELNRLYGILKSKTLNDNLIIFDGSYFLDGKFYQGSPLSEISSFYLNHSYNENDILPIEVNELLNHLVNSDDDTKEMLLDQLALVFLRNEGYREKYGKLIRLYGPTGKNGKSTLLKLLEKVYGNKNSMTYTLSKLSDDQTLVSLKNCLFAYDADSPASYADDKASTNLKKIVTADKLDARRLYSETENFTILASLFAASNYQFKSYDKTDAITRRLLPITTKKQLNKPNAWFDKLFSNKSVDSFRNFIITRAIKLSLNEKIFQDISKTVESELKSFRKTNNNVLSFIEDLGVDEIVGWTVKSVKSKYLKWCNDNDETPLQSTNYNSTIKSELNIESMPYKFKYSKDFITGSDLQLNTSDPESKIRIWTKISD